MVDVVYRTDFPWYIINIPIGVMDDADDVECQKSK